MRIEIDFDPYDVLGVRRDATQKEIKTVYRPLARMLHPDMGGDEEAFKQAAHAYEIVSDSEKRREYDLYYEWQQAEAEKQRLAAEAALERELEEIERRQAEDRARAEQQAEAERQRQASANRPPSQQQPDKSKADISLNIMLGVVGMGWLIAIAAVLFVLVVVSPLILAVLRFILALIEAAGS